MKAARIPMKASAATPPIYQLHIELRDLKPAIWRRVLVPQSVTLAKLHQVIQIAMGWTTSHLPFASISMPSTFNCVASTLRSRAL